MNTLSPPNRPLDIFIKKWNPVVYMYEKNFDEWNHYKKIIHAHRRPLRFRVGEIWYCSVGINVGAEQDGKNRFFERPVLVVKVFNRELFWGVPLTSTHKDGIFYHSFECDGLTQTAILSQLACVDVGRLRRKSFRINAIERTIIREKIKQLL